MTGRGALVLLAACAPLVVAGRFSVLLFPAIAAVVLAAVAVAVDALRAPGVRSFVVERRHDRVVPVGRPATVVLRVSARDVPGSGMPVVVRDEHPSEIPATAESLQGRLRAGETTDFRYALTPVARGTHAFGNVVIRARGPLGLGTRHTSISLGDDALQVDPDLTAISSYEALVRRGRLVELGVRSVRRRGQGTEFERVREAVPDDPLRSINWRATARTGRLMATELTPERSQPIIVCIDHGRLMGVGAGVLTKLDHAASAALLLLHVALRSGDRAGLLAFGARVTAAVPPRAGRGHMQALLAAVRPLAAEGVEADFEEALGFLSRWHRRRALVCILTDVTDLDQAASLVRECARLRRQHLPLVITVRDPALDEAARRPPVQITDVYARTVASGLLAQREQVLATLRVAGVHTLDTDARAVSPRLVNRYLELKARSAV